MIMERRNGMTVPLGGPLHSQREQFEELVDLGYSDVWSAESDGGDAFTPLALASVWTPSLRLGTAIVPAYTRGPACLAQSVASLASAAPGRFAIGIGSSSNVIVERWNGIPFVEPYKRVRDTVRFLRAALSGEKVTETYDTFAVNGFRLGLRVEQPVPILVAGLRPGMLRLAGRESDGAIINWLSPTDVRQVAAEVDNAAAAAGRPQPEIVARIFCVPSEDTDTVRAAGKRMIAAYLNVPVYADFHRWLGRTEQLAGMWEKWQAGDRAGALEAIPDQVVDDLVVHGSYAQCRRTIDAYFANGVTTSSLAILPLPGVNFAEAVRELSPKAGCR
jgi:probable F420-dependent oxidoreductase